MSIRALVDQVANHVAPVLDGLEVVAPTTNPPVDGVVWRYSHTGFIAADGVSASMIEGGLTIWFEVYSQSGGIGRVARVAENIVTALIRAPSFEDGDSRIEYRDGTSSAVGPQEGGQQVARAIIRYNIFRLITD